MRVSIEHVEKSQGLVFRKTLHGVAVTVTFSAEEMHIIQTRNLSREIIMERGVPADVDADKHAERGLARKMATAAFKGFDANHFHLTIGKLMRGTDTYFLNNPFEAKQYEAELREALPALKGYISENEGIEEKSSSFEL